ncbi:Cytochrome P450 83B1 [Linum grandiflorum]
MSSLVYLLLALPIFIFLLFLHHNKPKNDNLPPGPPALPFLGNLLNIDHSAPHRSLYQLSQKYGPLMSVKQGRLPVLVVSSANMAREVMKTHDHIFCNRPSSLGTKRLTYNCRDMSFSPYGTYWREMRKTCIVHLFNSNKTQTFCPIRKSVVSKMIDDISNSASSSDQRRRPFNLSKAMSSLTSTLVCRAAFGKSFEEEGELDLLLKEGEAMFTAFFFSDHYPLLGFLDRLTGLMGRLEKIYKVLDAFYQKIIDEHLNPKRLKPEQEEEDMLDVLLRIKDDASSKVQLTFDHIKALIMDIFFAGTDTSAATVIWAMTYLMRNPIAMKKAQDEIRQVVGKQRLLDEEVIHQLPYLQAVIKETMRLQPAVPLLLPRVSSSEECVDLGGYKIPANTSVYVNVYAIGRDVEAWGENPEDFKPERFILGTKSTTDVKGLDFELIPFGAGRRMCPGIHMGLATVEISLANLLYGFDWEMPDGMKREDLDMEVSPGLTMQKKTDLCLMANKYTL